SEFSDRYRHHFVQLAADLAPFDGVVPMLEALKSKSTLVTIATGKSRAGLDRALDDANWRPFFASTRCADEGAPKPDPWMLNDLCESMGVAPSNTVMIGDTSHDLNMAASAGTHSIGVTYGAHPRAELAALASIGMVDNANDLHALLMVLIGEQGR
ncbi:MAG: HAD-IA family hydrolase, partial [Burkholderiaceae bacterium]